MATVCVRLVKDEAEFEEFKKKVPTVKIAIKDGETYDIKDSNNMDETKFDKNVSMYVQVDAPDVSSVNGEAAAAAPAAEGEAVAAEAPNEGEAAAEAPKEEAAAATPAVEEVKNNSNRASQGGTKRKTSKRGRKSSKGGRKSAKRGRKSVKRGRKGKGSRRSKK